MTQLSVNVNKIATLRNSRGQDVPNVLSVALDIERFGANGITVHPRPDERHIKTQDVYDLKEKISVELNVEGYPSKDFIQLICNVRPAQVTLVPDPPHVLTSNAGWDVKEKKDFLCDVIQKLKTSGARVSLFIDPFDYQESDLREIKDTGTDAIELYTERYAKMFHTPVRDDVLSVYKNAAYKAKEFGMRVNAGHDLNLDNLNYFLKTIGCIDEVSIGHALICDALYLGLEKTLIRYLSACLA